MSQLRVLLICLMMIALPASQVSADVDESNSNSEVTIGFGNVTNDTMILTMDTSVDVYAYNVTFVWESGSIYCGVQSWGGLSEDYQFFVSILYAGCSTSGYYYGAAGERWIPSGSNDTLTSFYYQSLSPEICIGSATYAVMLSDGEFEYRDADFDSDDCLSYTRYEVEWPNDVWFELNDGGSDSEVENPYANSEVVDGSDSNSEVIVGFGDVTNETMVLTIDTSVDVTAFDISVQSMICDYGFGGAAEDASFSVSTANNIGMAHSSGCNILGYYQGEGTSYIPAGTNEDLTSWSYLGSSEEICIMHAFYATEVGGDWLEADLDANYCLDYTFVYPEDSWEHWFELNDDQSKLEIDEYGISEHDTVLWAFQNSPYFSTLLQALEMTNLTEVLSPENTPQMGYTVFAPTNDAFNATGIYLDDFDSPEGIDVLTEVLLYHVTFAGPYGLDMGMAYNSSSGEYEPYCQPYTTDWTPMQNGEYADPFNYSSWTETVIISNDCQGNVTVNQANVIDTDNRVYGFNETTDWPSFSSATDNGMIQVIDSVLIPSSFNFTPPNNDEPRFNPRFDIPSNLENDGEFGDLMDALGMTMLMDDINIENSPQMGMTIFAPTDEAFAAAGINLDDYDSLQKLEGLSEILLNHISFDWVLSFPDECTPTEFDMETTDSFSVTISNDCEGNIFVNEAKILYSQGVENGVIFVIDKMLMPTGEDPVEEPVEEPVDTTIETPVDDIPLQNDGSNVDGSGPSVILGQSSTIFGAIILFAMVLVLVGTAAVRSPKSRLDSIIMKQDVEADELLTLLSRSKMVQIIHTLHSEENPIRFTELKNRVDTSSTTLTRRLGELEDHNLVERTDYETVPPTVVYKLTDSGASLLPSLETFFEWVLDDTKETE